MRSKTLLKRAFFAAVLFTAAALLPGIANADALRGRLGYSTTFHSGWLDLLQKRDFHAGQTLRITFDRGMKNPAKEAYVRLLPNGSSPTDEDDPVDVIKINANVVDVPLIRDYSDISQVSVHGGPHPFSYSLSPDNGDAKLRSVEVLN